MNARQLLAFDQRSARVGEALWPCTITLAGEEYPANAPPPRVLGTEGQGGVDFAADLMIRLRKEVLPDPPAIEQEVRAHDRVWFIRDVRSAETDAVWVLRCELKN
jgi:hypothetical protein